MNWIDARKQTPEAKNGETWIRCLVWDSNRKRPVFAFWKPAEGVFYPEIYAGFAGERPIALAIYWMPEPQRPIMVAP